MTYLTTGTPSDGSAAARTEHRLAIIAGEDVHIAPLREHQISVGRSQSDAATSLSQDRVELRDASEFVELQELAADKIYAGANQRTRMCSH